MVERKTITLNQIQGDIKKKPTPGTPNNQFFYGCLVISNHFPWKDLVKIIQLKQPLKTGWPWSSRQ